MKYLNLQTTNEPYAWALSSAIWRITNPFLDENLTGYYTSPVSNDDGIWVLPLTDDLYRIHPRADFSSLVDIVDAPDNERAAFVDGLRSLRGKKVRAADLIPQAWQAGIMTEEQARAAGFLENVHN
jgi:hypothetical protein